MKTWKRGRRPPDADAARGDVQTPKDTPTDSGAVAEGRLAGLGRGVSSVATTARQGVTTLIAHAPEAMRATRAAARDSTGALQTLPDSTLRWLAASSIGLGAGFALRHSPRLAVAAGMAPAVLIGAAIALRPAEPIAPDEDPE